MEERFDRIFAFRVLWRYNIVLNFKRFLIILPICS